MLMELSVVFVGLGSLMGAWVLPMVSDHLPRRFQIGLLLGGLALIIGGASQGIWGEFRLRDMGTLERSSSRHSRSLETRQLGRHSNHWPLPADSPNARV
jgi:hypothetical protein